MVFGVDQFNGASHIWLGQTVVAWQLVVATATKICDFQNKIGYSLTCAGDTYQMLAPTRGISGSVNLMVSVKLCPDNPCCHGNENWENFIR